MADVRSTLDRVWKELRQASIVDDLLIIEYIAAVLVEMAEKDTPWPFDEQLRPQKQKVRYNVDDLLLKNWLEDAASTNTTGNPSIQDLANLFDPHILFFPSHNSGKESYPTPRHIVAFMLGLAQIAPDNSFADFACGSGSFLIDSGIKDNKFHPLGIDISANWIRIAAANAFLHRRTNIEFQQADSFHYLQGRKPNTFTRIVMSPPLKSIGIKVHSSPSGTDREIPSDIAFTELLLDHLKASGRAVTIVSSAFLEGPKPGDNWGEYLLLKSQLIAEQLLRAVITQQNGLFLKKEPVHIFSISKGQDHHTDYTWFCRIEKDGYPIEKQRNFIEEANTVPEQNDIPFLQQVLQKKWKAGGFDHFENEVRIKAIVWQNVLRGIVLQPDNGAIITNIYRIYVLPLKLAVSIKHITLGNMRLDIEFRLTDVRIHTREATNEMALNAETGELLFIGGELDQLIAISADGRLLGVTQTQEQIPAHDYILSPQYYLDYYSGKRENIEQPATPIQQKSRPESFIPPEPIHLTLPETSQYDAILPRILNAEQYAVWEAIKRYTRYFTPLHIRQVTEQTDVTSTLNLLENMGLIRQVSLAAGTRETATVIDRVYRRLSIDEISIGGPSNVEQPQPQSQA